MLPTLDETIRQKWNKDVNDICPLLELDPNDYLINENDMDYRYSGGSFVRGSPLPKNKHKTFDQDNFKQKLNELSDYLDKVITYNTPCPSKIGY